MLPKGLLDELVFILFDDQHRTWSTTDNVFGNAAKYHAL